MGVGARAGDMRRRLAARFKQPIIRTDKHGVLMERPMPADPIHDHIAAARSRSDGEMGRLTSRIVARCWPGGGSDRSEPAALAWVRHWRPSKVGARLPACSCTAGHCPVCN
jgi:hypothetical protein